MKVRLIFPLLVSAVAALGGTSVSAQSREDDLEAVRAAALRAGMNADRCFRADDDDVSAIQTLFERIPLSRLGDREPVAGQANAVRVGAYTYEGGGIVVTSADPQFAELRIDLKTSQPTLPDGRRLVVSNLVWSETGGDCRLSLSAPADEGNRGATRAAAAGAVPVLDGYRPGATWPSRGERFLGLMHPDSEADETVIVDFRAGPDPDMRVRARLPMAFQGLTTLPDLHRPRTALRLNGFQGDGSLVEMILMQDDSQLIPRDGS